MFPVKRFSRNAIDYSGKFDLKILGCLLL
jgi:hypothetical protein